MRGLEVSCGNSPLDDEGSGLNEPLYREFQRYKKNTVNRIAITEATTSTGMTQTGTTCGNESCACTPRGSGPGCDVGVEVDEDVIISS